MASIRKSIFAKTFYATVIFFLECRTHSGISNFLLQLPVRLFVRPTQMQARIIADCFVLFGTIDREEHLDNNIPFWGLCLAMKDTQSEFCSNTLR